MTHFFMDPAFASLKREPRPRLFDAREMRLALAAARREAAKSELPLDVQSEDFSIPAKEGETREISLRIYRPPNVTGALPVLLYLHGGGFFCGDQFSEELQCASYASGSACAVVCVGYRLAPEHPFPAAVNDCYRVLEFLNENTIRLRLIKDRIAVGGSSAGANLAAAMTLLARDRNGPRICFQMLLIPALDPRLETVSARQMTGVPDFGRQEAEIMWRWYLAGHEYPFSPYAAPAMATDLSGLPPAYLLCAGLDPLRDEGLDYAQRLTAAGVAVELHLVPSIPHGFASVPAAAISRRLLQEQVAVLRGAFHSEEDGR